MILSSMSASRFYPVYAFERSAGYKAVAQRRGSTSRDLRRGRAGARPGRRACGNLGSPDGLRSLAGGRRLAQRESASFTPRRSLVRSQYRPPPDLRLAACTWPAFTVPCARTPVVALKCSGPARRFLDPALLIVYAVAGSVDAGRGKQCYAE